MLTFFVHLSILFHSNYYARCSKNATNVQAEIEAVKFGIEYAARLGKRNVSIFSDSNLVVEAVNDIIKKWKTFQHSTRMDGQEYRTDFESLEQIIRRNSNMNIKINWVPAHSSNTNHNEADRLARKGAELP